MSRCVLCSDYCLHIPFHIKIPETAYTHLLVATITWLISHLATGSTVWVSYPNRDRRFSLLQNHLDWLWGPPSFLFDGYFRFFLPFLISFSSLPPSLSLSLFFFSPGFKQMVHDDDHSLPSSTKDNNEWSYTSTPSICLHGMLLDNCTFNFTLNFLCTY